MKQTIKNQPKALFSDDCLVDHNETPESLVQVSCEVNYSSIYGNHQYQGWKCVDCNMDFICEPCKKCHKSHEGSLRPSSISVMNEQTCSCALKNHKVVHKGSKSNKIVEHCPFSEVDFDAQYYTLFLQKKQMPNEYVCSHCFENCISSINKANYSTFTKESGTIKCSCHLEKGHKGSDYTEKANAYFSFDTNLNMLSHKLLKNDSITHIIFDVLEKLGSKIRASIDSARDPFLEIKTLSLNTKDEEQQKGQMHKFVKCLKTLNKLGKDLSTNTDFVKKFSYNYIIEILQIQELKGRKEFLLYLQMFYLKIFRYIFLPKTRSIELFSNNISSLHRILLLKSPKQDHDKNIAFRQIEGLLNQLKEIIDKTNNPRDVISEYMKLLDYYIDLSINNFPSIDYVCKTYLGNLIEGLKKVPFIDEKLAKKIGRLYEKFMLVQNDYYLYYKIFKRTLSEGNIKEEVHYSYENTELNQSLLSLLFNQNIETNNTIYDYNAIIDNLTDPHDDFIESLEQFHKTEIPLNDSLYSFIDSNEGSYLKIIPLQSNHEEMLNKMRSIEDKIGKSFDNMKGLNFEEIIEEINQLVELLANSLKDKKYLMNCQMVFVSSKLLTRLIIIFNQLQQMDKESESKSKKITNDLCKLLYDIILLICDNNPFITVLFFNHHRNASNLSTYLLLRNIKALKLYFKLLKILDKAEYKINTEIFCEIFGLYINKVITDKKILSNEEFILFTQTAKRILSVSNDKSYAKACQSLSTDIYSLSLNHTIDNHNYEKILQLPLSDYKEDHYALLKSYFSFINKLSNDNFDLIKHTIDINDIINRLKESIDQSKMSPKLALMRRELILFYSKYSFSSLYAVKDDNLLDYSDIQITMAKIMPLLSYAESFLDFLHMNLSEKQMLSCLIKGVCIPSFILIWKISSFGVIDGVSKYVTYSLTCWIFILFKNVLRILDQKFKNSQRTETDIKRILAPFITYCNEMEQFSSYINKEYIEMKDEDFPCLDDKKCLEKFIGVMKTLKFFNENQKIMKFKQLEYKEDNDSNEKREEDNVLKDLSASGKLKRVIEKYINAKTNNNVLIELFNAQESDSTKATVIGSVLINVLTKMEDNPIVKEPMNRINIFDMSKTRYLNIIVKLFLQNPKYWQEMVLTNTSSSYFIHLLTNNVVKIFSQFVYADYARILITDTPYYNLLIDSIEFLRLLCEDHNPYFQTLLIQNNKFFPASYPLINLIFDMAIEITKHVQHFSQQNNPLIQYFNKEKYFNRLNEKLCDFQIELIQGTKVDNLIFIAANPAFSNYINSNIDFMEYCIEGKEYADLTQKFLQFLNCYFEEFMVFKHINLSKYINPLLIKLNPKKLSNFAEKTFFKFILNQMEDKKDKITMSIIKGNIKEKNGINYYNAFKSKCKELKKNTYLKYDELTSDPYFMISFNIFLHLTQMKDFQNEKYGIYDQILISLSLSKEEKKYSGLFYDFCSFLLLNTEVMYTLNFEQNQSETDKYINLFKEYFCSSDNIELKSCFEKAMCDVGGEQSIKQINRLKIYYLAEKDSLLLTKYDYYSFHKVAVHDDYYTKLSGILNYYHEYSTTIDMRKLFTNMKKPFLIGLNEMNYGVLEQINCILCLVASVLMIFKTPGNIYTDILFYFEIVHLAFLLVLMTNYFIFNTLKIKYFSDNKEESCGTIAWSVSDSQILPFEWMFVWGLLGMRYDFLLSLQLFAIFNISPTMKSALLAIKTRYDQFIATGFLLIILIMFYSALTLYFFAVKSDATYWCTSYWECFLYMMNNGIRSGGLGFDQKIIDQSGYWSEFIYSWIFYFLIILIIMNIINGIIVDTFQALREQNNEIEVSRKDICFICQLSRCEFDNKELDFNNHIKTEHNVMNYFKYLFKLHRTDQHDLNAVNYQVYNSIKAGRVDFFPIEKADGFDSDENEEIEETNKNNDTSKENEPQKNESKINQNC